MPPPFFIFTEKINELKNHKPKAKKEKAGKKNRRKEKIPECEIKRTPLRRSKIHNAIIQIHLEAPHL